VRDLSRRHRYGADGRPTGQAWLGLPNSSINLEAYTLEVYQATRAGLAEPDTLLARVDALFPGRRGWSA
jgi:hypothetical protein